MANRNRKSHLVQLKTVVACLALVDVVRKGVRANVTADATLATSLNAHCTEPRNAESHRECSWFKQEQQGWQARDQELGRGGIVVRLSELPLSSIGLPVLLPAMFLQTAKTHKKAAGADCCVVAEGPMMANWGAEFEVAALRRDLRVAGWAADVDDKDDTPTQNVVNEDAEVSDNEVVDDELEAKDKINADFNTRGDPPAQGSHDVHGETPLGPGLKEWRWDSEG
ncbi:hypothetical protein BU17DRAFT_93110 [Hysterangium stoloniferum]|nr:hypothetical protein BU17DRAFT_93110 [Hysterangium stoloniferum]